MVSLTFHTSNRVYLLDFYESQQYEKSEENDNAVLLSGTLTNSYVMRFFIYKNFTKVTVHYRYVHFFKRN